MIEEVSILMHASSWLPLDESNSATDLPTSQIAVSTDDRRMLIQE